MPRASIMLVPKDVVGLGNQLAVMGNVHGASKEDSLTQKPQVVESLKRSERRRTAAVGSLNSTNKEVLGGNDENSISGSSDHSQDEILRGGQIRGGDMEGTRYFRGYTARRVFVNVLITAGVRDSLALARIEELSNELSSLKEELRAEKARGDVLKREVYGLRMNLLVMRKEQAAEMEHYRKYQTAEFERYKEQYNTTLRNEVRLQLKKQADDAINHHIRYIFYDVTLRHLRFSVLNALFGRPIE
ncbi:hypothetical protein M427DRAFT_42344 [Gonapodya prolifera JEL478]|uniref:Uncharacterized protein n=1 Tax=Gonapodya prolifera (strain JEL478) TaxID=1344416 RepID=A0A139AQB6_GONPJ|nr:hypothetical protein M427DRAFT_42344 [Gonapodya prolifera JEL478]|eukprot:KXS18675.1 hypothetical protein M427DRAFT_42344 [Gonapodya prolifera JEL478]